MTGSRLRGRTFRDGAADLVDDVLEELSARRTRALMMVFAVALSAGALVASAGISDAASRQIGADIAASTLDLVGMSVVPVPDDDSGVDHGRGTATILPDETDERLASVDLVMDGGRRLDIDAATQITRFSDADPLSRAPSPSLTATTSGYLRAARAEVPEDRIFLLDGTLPVALLGAEAAQMLDIPIVADPTGLTVWIGGVEYDVVGFIGESGPAALSGGVVIPYDRGLSLVKKDAESTVLVRTAPGAGAQVASVIALAVRPDAPERLAVSPVVSVESLRTGVSTQLDRLAAWTASILMVLTILLIANSMVVSVTARSAEIGVRRALGCSRRHVAATFLTEGSIIGLLGGLAGAALGAITVVVTCVLNEWTVVLPPLWIAAGPAIGLAVGLLSSAYPSGRAAGISPAEAVRAE